MTVAGTRLRMFMKHHSKLTSRIRGNNVKLIISKSTYSLHEELEVYRARVEQLSKRESLKRICTAKTCSKCAKYVMVESIKVLAYCSIILNAPNCCPTQHILLTGF